MEISLTDSKGHNARIPLETVTSRLRVRWVDRKQRQVASRKILRGAMNRDMAALEAEFGDPAAVGRALIEGDPEVDLETYGTFLEDTHRVYVDRNREIAHRVVHWEIVHAPDGSEKERRPRRPTEPNAAGEIPLKWTGEMLPRAEVYNRFVFSSKLQIVHYNGLTYEFLFHMAKELVEKDALMLLGAGSDGNQPLIFRRGGTPCRGFLEGRVDGDRYALILHLSNLELRRPDPDGDSPS